MLLFNITLINKCFIFQRKHCLILKYLLNVIFSSLQLLLQQCKYYQYQYPWKCIFSYVIIFETLYASFSMHCYSGYFICILYCWLILTCFEVWGWPLQLFEIFCAHNFNIKTTEHDSISWGNQLVYYIWLIEYRFISSWSSICLA